MRKINASEVVAASKFNRFHLLVFLWCVFAIAFDGYDIAMYGVGLPLMMQEWNLTPVEAGVIGSYTLVGMMVGALVFSPLADTIGRKKVLAVCMFLFSVFTLLAGLASNPTFFTVMRFIAALGMGGIMPNVISLMTEYSPKKNRALTVATMYCGYSLGGILASLIGMYVMEDYSWRMLYWIGIIPLFTLPLFMKQFPESLSYYIVRNQAKKLAEILNRINPYGNYEETDDYEFASAKESAKGFPVKKLFENKRAVSTFAFWMAGFSCLLMVYGINTWLPKIMQQFGYGLTSSLSFNLVLCVGQIGGSLMGGYLVDKIGHRKVLTSMYILGAVCFVILGLTSNVFALYFLIALGGGCTVGTMNLTNPYISEYYPREARATGIGWALGIGRIGAILAPTLVGLLLAMKLPPQNAFMAFAIPSVIGAVALLFVQEKFGSYDKVSVQEKQDIKLEV
ncbi:Gentisate transporter [Bacillus rhizoplanae]|uniref:Gentisate transporter n=1 Tax=Bacillus rhizoplanae TaxID=2880966 RepID=A0ABM8YGQ9_9BACI|nr:MFS transporter [Bacillus rhizoplanae]CAG9614941.1 Gentisate transporter [Bacillus rhizoplanae]